MDGKKITLKDIAGRAGLSINTISRALKDKEDIAPATREVIKTLAKEMGYVGNSVAGSLRSGHTRTIAVIVSDVANPHFGIMVKDIEQAARKHNYTIFVINTEEDNELEERAIHTAISKNVDGIIICPAQSSTENIEFMKRNGIPFVLIGRRFNDETDYDYVICDDEKGGYLATKHLLDNGHERILFLNGRNRISSAQERYMGYKRAHEEAGLTVDPLLVKEVGYEPGDTRKTVKMMVENESFTGIFAFNDVIAWEAMYVLQMMGCRIPEEYAIIGFDNIHSRMFVPFPLSSISSSKGEMARRALDILLRKISEPNEKKSYREVVDTTLIWRVSTIGNNEN
ncbi:LacI family DNA-binding transcriptional regulator [Paenibacillus sp. OV219]|uniref:LacI family DNA-binding transcriptional regulator n=1 Tax=Paenibacillus sp. OV219 TaxID=1884377 RepID=UPI0008B8645C|nr:LacI family DNA-binding transcriptional regulator [Paenibacillus sp. OV219]SEO73211.1 transcriptional regulator, LacI family [Paenibacillus sp. OV219]